jgi:hypothetical protein
MPQALPSGEGGKMKEEWVDKKAELLNMLNCIEGNHLVDCDEKATKYTEKCCDAIRKLIEDTNAYDERIDEIVEYYRRQDSNQNLTDCTEAIDALIEERDALIEDLEHKRVVTITRCDEDALFEGSPESFHERLVKMLKEKGVEVK